MFNFFANLFASFPSSIATFLISALPVGEHRLGIPIGLTVYHLPAWQAYLSGLLGSFFPVIFIIFLLKKVADWLSLRSRPFKRFFDWIFDHTKNRHSKKVEVLGDLALVFFAAMPVPVIGGAWTAALVAFVFGIEYKRSLPLIFLGLMIGCGIVLLLTLGIVKL